MSSRPSSRKPRAETSGVKAIRKHDKLDGAATITDRHYRAWLKRRGLRDHEFTHRNGRGFSERHLI